MPCKPKHSINITTPFAVAKGRPLDVLHFYLDSRHGVVLAGVSIELFVIVTDADI